MPGVGKRDVCFFAQKGVGGMFSTQRKRWYVRKTEKEKDESGFFLGYDRTILDLPFLHVSIAGGGFPYGNGRYFAHFPF